MKPAKCPFYPDSCSVEFHPNMQHLWRKDSVPVRATVTNVIAQPITNKASERAQAWNKANREKYNARQKVLMQARRGKRGG